MRTVVVVDLIKGADRLESIESDEFLMSTDTPALGTLPGQPARPGDLARS